MKEQATTLSIGHSRFKANPLAKLLPILESLCWLLPYVHLGGDHKPDVMGCVSINMHYLKRFWLPRVRSTTTGLNGGVV